MRPWRTLALGKPESPGSVGASPYRTGLKIENEDEHEHDWLVLSTRLRRRSLDILEVDTALL
jgi:hypothetical protein